MSYETSTQNQEVITLVKQLKKKSISFNQVPEEYRCHPLIVKTERKLGIRKIISKGYDIIQNKLFVDEQIDGNYSVGGNEITSYFDDFSSYYEFLQGDIYENGCYYGYSFPQKLIEKYSIDLSKLNFQSLIEYTIDDFSLEFNNEERAQYQAKESKKEAIVKALEKLYACTNYNEFQKQVGLASEFSLPVEFFLTNFIFHDKEKAFDFVMEYISQTYYFGFEEKMCLIYDPQRVYAAYKNTHYAQSTAKKYKYRLKRFITALEKRDIKLWKRVYFDEQTHFFIYYTIGGYKSNSEIIKEVELFRYFESFEELMEFRKNDLSYCDLSKAIMPNLDLSKYKIGKHTYLPIQYQNALNYSLEKTYDRGKQKFVVNQNWVDGQGVSIKSYHHTFKYFFDFFSGFSLRTNTFTAIRIFCAFLMPPRKN